MGKVDQANNAINHGKSYGGQSVNTSERDPVAEMLHKHA
jgi:hypothetical protein